jgi:hypothetical protein
MINVERETLRLLTKAVADIPGRPHSSTILRWALRGVKGVRLETIVVGGRRFTSVEAIGRFILRLSEPPVPHNSTADSEQGEKAARIDSKLDQAGFK